MLKVISKRRLMFGNLHDYTTCMNPNLVALFGPVQGSTFKWSDQQITIGRDPSNWLCLNDRLVSRKHCEIIGDGDVFTIRDLDSRNGIMVNGLPVKERVLQHGDQLEIGDSLFLFLIREQENDSVFHSVSNIEGVVFQSTTRLPAQEALYLKPEKLLADGARQKRTARDLQVLLKISSVLYSEQDRDSLQKKLLQLILEYIPAERGAVVGKEKSSGEYISFCAWDRKEGPVANIEISFEVIGEALRDGVSILCNDIHNSDQSSAAATTASLLCAPMISFLNMAEVIYLSTNDTNTSFDEGHLQLLTGIAGIASVASKNVEQKENLKEENRRLQSEFSAEYHIIGESPAMKSVFRMIEKLAASDSTVLIRGESGTGKELVARALHLKSARAMKPFIAINCAALAESLLQTELFGHEKGAFTGAVARKKGKLEIADGGTVFLDEVSEIAPALQAKLLRVIQEREFERVGGNDPIHVDIRIIAATNRDLEDAIKQGHFRQDLFFRLNVVSITMPPLRERREDIPLLASYFASKFGKKLQRRIKGISEEAKACFMKYEWTGNVRELENCIERAVVLGSTEFILREDLPENIVEAASSEVVGEAKFYNVLQRTKKQLLQDALNQTNGDYHAAAKLLGVHPSYMYRLMRTFNVKATPKIN
jgi:transcriptional regulator with GAF, ATPase, and Fis domain